MQPIFLIENMDGQCYSITKIVDTSGNNVDFNVLDYPNYSTMVAGWDSIENKIGSIDFKRDTLIYDVNYITADYLIENIDMAFIAWKNPGQHILHSISFANIYYPTDRVMNPLKVGEDNFLTVITGLKIPCLTLQIQPKLVL